jgi:chromosome partitioning protein
VGKIVAITNQKASLTAIKRKILLIDIDPQGNATTGSGLQKDLQRLSITHLLLNDVSAQETTYPTKIGYDIIPANSSLTTAAVKLLYQDQREYRLQNLLRPIIDNYDFVFIDCPPSLNILTINALIAANSVIIPMQCEYYALEGLTGLLSTIEQLTKSLHSELEIEGLLRTMYDGRNRLTIDVSEQLLTHFPEKVYNTVIPRNVRLAEAPSHGIPVLQYDKRSQGAIAYLALAAEFIRRNEEDNS